MKKTKWLWKSQKRTWIFLDLFGKHWLENKEFGWVNWNGREKLPKKTWFGSAV